MQSNHNSLCEQFRPNSSQARSSPDHLRFTVSSKGPETVLKPLMNITEDLGTTLWASDLN